MQDEYEHEHENKLREKLISDSRQILVRSDIE